MPDRKAALQKLADEFGLDPEDDSYSGNEDIAGYLLDGEEIHRFAAVTISGEFVYIYPTFDTREAAQDKAAEYVTDSLYTEGPVAVVDLDTGQRWEPDWDALPWKEAS